jgi:hypothetical protein
MAIELQLAEALMLLCDLRKATGSRSAAEQLLGWATNCRVGKVSKAGLVKTLQKLLTGLTTGSFTVIRRGIGCL